MQKTAYQLEMPLWFRLYRAYWKVWAGDFPKRIPGGSRLRSLLSAWVGFFKWDTTGLIHNRDGLSLHLNLLDGRLHSVIQEFAQPDNAEWEAMASLLKPNMTL